MDIRLPEEVPLRSYSIGRILAQKEKTMRDPVVCAFVGEMLSDGTYFKFVRAVRRTFPSKGADIPEDLWMKSLRSLAAQRLTIRGLSSTAWRLAGNLHCLRGHEPVLPWGKQSESEWVPIQIRSADPRRTLRGKSAASFMCLVLAGSSCPLVLEKFWTTGYCSLLSSELGFSRPWNDSPYSDTRQLINLRFYGLVEPRLCGQTPNFIAIRVTGTFRKWNRDLIKNRLRLNPEKFDCPRMFPPEFSCHLCPMGYDECPVGTHPVTFEQRYCRRCKKDRWFDPEKSCGICVECQEYLTRKGRA